MKQHNAPFITFEGGEGSGKSTQAQKLSDYLTKLGITNTHTREPGGSPGAELIRALVLIGDVSRWDKISESLLFNAARRDHLHNVIWPKLKAGEWMICDRFNDSTLAYQGYGHGVDINELNQLYAMIAGTFQPDLTFVFDIDPTVGLKRSLDRKHEEVRFESLDLDYHNRVRQGFLSIAQQDDQRCVVIDADQPIDSIFSTLLEILKTRFKDLL